MRASSNLPKKVGSMIQAIFSSKTQDKTKEQRTRIVKDATEQERAFKEGWRVQQHIPQEPTVDLAADFEAEMPEEAHTEPRRGPGRPPRAVEAA